MSIILELQAQAMRHDSDVLSLLRMAYMAARKLKLNDFQRWIESELNGYNDDKEVPKYRYTHGELHGWNPYRGWIPVIIKDPKMEKLFRDTPIYNSLPDLQSLVSKDNSTRLVCPIPASPNNILSSLTGFETKFAIIIPMNSVVRVIESVKNKLLDWALMLEENGVQGNGISFTPEEKGKAQNSPQVINYTSNFYGDVSETQIQQGTDASEQFRS